MTVIDKIHCLYQGRPPHLWDSESNVPVLFLDDFEELEAFSPLSYSASSPQTSLPLHNITVFTKTCELCIIMERLLTNLYTEKKTHEDQLHPHGRIEALQSDLNAWRKSLPPPLDFRYSDAGARTPAPHVISLLYAVNSLP